MSVLKDPHAPVTLSCSLAPGWRSGGRERSCPRTGAAGRSMLLTTLVIALAGGKGSGIFDEMSPVQTRQRLNPPGGKTSDIFGSPVAATSPLAHPNKPKVWTPFG